MTKLSVRLLFSILFLATVACSSRSEEGEACAVDDDCKAGECIVGGSFPEGVCTTPCESDADCPDDFSCISRSSGICLPQCASDSECEELRGDSWQCREESLEEGDGNQLVCIGD